MDFDTEKYKWFDKPLKDMFSLMSKNKFTEKEEYTHWLKGIIKFIE